MSERLDKVTAAYRDRQDPEKLRLYQHRWLKKMEFLSGIAASTHAATLLHDVSINRFLYFSDRARVLGNYHPGDFTSEVGVDVSFSNIPVIQRNAALLIQLKVFSYGIENPHTCLNNIIGNMTFQYKKKGGGFFQMLQKTMAVETNAEGLPVLYLRHLYDISHLIHPSVGLIINTPDENIIWTYNSLNKSLDKVNLLSSQEKKVLGFLAEGRCSKEIADLLFISSHTIDTHRRNLLRKTHCIDTTALVTYAKMTGLI